MKTMRTIFALLLLCATILCTSCKKEDNTIAVSDITLNKTTLSLKIGEKEMLTATIDPEDATDNSVIWSSSNDAVVTVSKSGEVTAMGLGEAEITVTSVANATQKETCAVAVILYSEWDGSIATAYAGGDGSEQNPFLIETAAQFALLGSGSASSNVDTYKYFKLSANIDLEYRDWKPIGEEHAFYGVFDGDGHIIRGLKTKVSREYTTAGLFSQLKYADESSVFFASAIRNLNVKNAQVTPNTRITGVQGTGILVGDIQGRYNDKGVVGYATVSNCHVSGTITGIPENAFLGGLAGHMTYAKIENCSADITISGGVIISGGLVGMMAGSQISGCTAKGTIEGQWTMGGLVGSAQNTTTNDGYGEILSIITNSTTSVNINTSNWNVGGFIGWLDRSEINNCSASGIINSTPLWNNHLYYTGGFVGGSSGKISNSTSSCTIIYSDGAQYYGGFLGGDIGGTTVNCRFDGTKNSEFNANGLSEKNDVAGTNDIKNSLK